MFHATLWVIGALTSFFLMAIGARELNRTELVGSSAAEEFAKPFAVMFRGVFVM